MAIKSKYTIVHASVWQWWPLMSCSPAGRMVWFALYTSLEAKRFPPGLWHGSLRVLAEAAHMTDADTDAGVTELMAAGLIERDPRSNVIRLSELPPEVDRPANGSTIKGWWHRFRDVPACPLRERHIALLHSLISTKADQQQAWSETFGSEQAKVDVTPTPSLQMEMFPSEASAAGLTESKAPVRSADRISIEKVPDSPPTPPHPLWIMDQGSGSQEGESERETPPTSTPTVVAAVVGSPVAEVRHPPVAPPLPTNTFTLYATPEGLLDALAHHSGGRVGRSCDPRLGPALRATLDACAAAGVTTADVERAGRYLAAGALAYRQDLGARWVSGSGNLLEVVEQARRWEAPGSASRPTPAMPVASPRRTVPPGYPQPVAGPERFQGGRRQL